MTYIFGAIRYFLELVTLLFKRVERKEQEAEAARALTWEEQYQIAVATGDTDALNSLLNERRRHDGHDL